MSDESNRLMVQAIHQAARHTAELQQLCSALSTELRAGPTSDSMTRLKTLLEGIACVSQALQLTRPVQLSEGIEPRLEDMPGALEPLVAALENRDWQLAGEVLTDELAPVLERWQGDLSKLIDRELGHSAL